MSEPEIRPRTDEQSPHTFEKPAVVIDGRSEKSDIVAGAILRAIANEFHPMVITAAGDPPETSEFAMQLDATRFEVSTLNDETTEPPGQVVEAGRELGFPGIIYQSNPAERINYSLSQSELTSQTDYVIDAIAASVFDVQPDLMVGIPAYNEADTITEVVSNCVDFGEVLVVDDGSQDNTPLLAREAGAEVIEHDENQGYGAALKTIFTEAYRSRATRLIILDGDGQHNPNDIPDFTEKLESTGADIVIGSRFINEPDGQIPTYRRFGLAVINLLTNFSLGDFGKGSRVSDTQSGYRLFNQTAIESLASDDTLGDGMSASTDILYHARSREMNIAEVETSMRYDVANTSSHGPLAHGMHLLNNLLRTIETQRPITVLGFPGIVLIMIGFGFGYWTFHNFLLTGTFPVGLGVTSVFFSLGGVFMTFTAIILHSLNIHFNE